MNQKYLLFGSVLFIIWGQNLCAQFHSDGLSARALGAGGAYLAQADEAEAVFINPAAIGAPRRVSFFLGYQKPFNMGELNQFSFAASKSFEKLQNLGVGAGIVSKTVGGAYSESQFIISVGGFGYKKRGWFDTNYIVAGISLRYFLMRAPGLSVPQFKTSGGGIFLDIGFLVKYKILKVAYTEVGTIGQGVALSENNKERAKTIRRAAFALNLPDVAYWFFQLNDVTSPRLENIHYGLELRFARIFSGRVGVFQKRLTIGIGLNVNFIRVSFATLLHKELGETTAISMRLDV